MPTLSKAMDSLKHKHKASLFLCLIPLLITTTLTSKEETEVCSEYVCGRKNGYVSIRFPFRVISNMQKPEPRCGYPGFDLYCDNVYNKTLFNIPNFGNFTVEGIDYRRQEILLSDPDDCLARKLLYHLDLSYSPFRFKMYDNISLYNCSEHNENYTSDNYWHQQKISCLSTTPNHAVIGVDPELFGYLLEPWCELIGNVTAPGNPQPMISHLGANMMLTWDEPQCGLCEGNVTRCGFNNSNNSLKTICIDYDSPMAPQPLSKRARYTIAISISFGVPIIAIGILVLYRVARYRRGLQEDINNDRGISVEMASHG